ncbi:hypothetical protein JEQ05_12480 [Serratia liquefaciens]|uniref:hypothetical protein n=1 Tax=Serratia liquefaciens TaxID=614 RepID=UPI0018E43AA7|nr:hypothetical protein [Serratia liquefaciens]MBI6162443.1 hypothetical protein [Serratia liquefaciens]
MADKLMRASKWLAREFEEGSIPDKRTVKRWIENGKVKGKVVDGMSYVYSSEHWGVQSEVSLAVNQLIRES